MSDVKVVGNYPDMVRFSTGSFSFDLALSKNTSLGAPYRTFYELYGNTNTGKSTVAYWLTATAAKANGSKNVSICDIELLDKEYIEQCYLSTGWKGTVHMVDLADNKGKPRDHMTMLMELVDNVRKPEVCAGIFDSVGAYMPIAESNAEFEEAVMGVRARAMAKFARRTTNLLENKVEPAIMVLVNHVHSVIGGRGHVTPGGETIKFMAGARLYLWQKEIIKSDDNIIGYVIEGTVEKLRFGGKGRKFRLVNLPGYGVHLGLCALFDCIELGLAERGAVIKLGDKSCGYISKFFDAAEKDNKDKFAPFFEALEEHKYREGFNPTGVEERKEKGSEPDGGENVPADGIYAGNIPVLTADSVGD